MNPKVFLFWLGENKQRTNRIVDSLITNKINFEIGPSDSEHKFLLENVPFYKKSFQQGVYAFCSDVWRAYKLSKEAGIYLDVSFSIGDGAKSEMERTFALPQKTILWNYSGWDVNNGHMQSNVENNKFFKELFEMYKKLDFEFVQLAPTGPVILSSLLEQKEKNSLNGNWDIFETKDILVLNVNYYNRQTIFHDGHQQASWFIKNGNKSSSPKSEDYQKWFNERKYNKNTRLARYLQLGYRHWNAPWVINIRELYEVAESKLVRKKLIDVYKNLPYKVKFSEKLIWSKFYVFFTFKWLNTK